MPLIRSFQNEFPPTQERPGSRIPPPRETTVGSRVGHLCLLIERDVGRDFIYYAG